MLKRKCLNIVIMGLLVCLVSGCGQSEIDNSDSSSLVTTQERKEGESIAQEKEGETKSEEEIAEVNSNEVVNPLMGREYHTYDADIDFSKYHEEFMGIYANYVSALSNYMESHFDELKEGKRFYDFSDYESTFLDMYTWAYKTINYDINGVSEEYRSYWKSLQNFAQYNLDMADRMYRESQEQRTETIDTFINDIDEKIDHIESLLPISEIKEGQTVITGEYEATLQKVEFSYDVEPTTKAILYSHYQAEGGKVYIHVDMDVKNLKKEDMRCDKICEIKADYNDGYTYSGFAVAEDSSGGFTYSSITAITPLETKGIHLLINCPEEVATSSNPLVLYITFFDKTEYIYVIR